MNILVVENNTTDLKCLQTLLSLGHTVHVCANGKKAVSTLSKKAYDALLLNVADPALGGVAIVPEVRETSLNRKIHIAALGDPENPGRFDAALPKPLRRKALLEWHQTLLPPETCDMSGPVLNRQAGLKLCDGDAGLYEELLEIFYEDSPRMVQRIQDTVGDSRDLNASAHALKGAAANICATRLRDAASQIEALAKSNDLEQAHPWVEHLLKEYQTLRETLKQDERPPTA